MTELQSNGRAIVLYTTLTEGLVRLQGETMKMIYLRMLYRLVVALLLVVPAYADQLTSIEKATHIVYATVESTATEWAGSLIPITNVFLRVDESIKNSGGALNPNSVIKILEYGCETKDNVIQTSKEEIILFRKGQRIIVPLQKYYEHYRMFSLDDPFALVYVTGRSAAAYDQTIESYSNGNGLSQKEQFYIRQQRQFRNHERQRRQMVLTAFRSDFMLKKTTRFLVDENIGDARAYMNLLTAKAQNSTITLARSAFTVAKVKVKEIRSVNAHGAGAEQLALECLHSLKGKRLANELIVPLPPENFRNAFGWRLPNIGETGIILLDKNDMPVQPHEFFIKSDQEGKWIIGNNAMSDQKLLQLLSKNEE
jgi:hypothetical protein